MSSSSSSSSSLRARFESAARLLAGHRDILDALPDQADGDEGALALERRGWLPALVGLSDDALEALEAGGLAASWPTTMPASLLALVEALRVLCDVPSLAPPPGPPTSPRRHQRPRKQAQVEAFAAGLQPVLAGARRIVDVGSGHGHLTRELAALVQAPVVGLECNPRLVDEAQRLARALSVAPSYETTNVLADDHAFVDGDCVVGLHACGELGDVMVQRAGVGGVVAVGLVGCCLQKRRGAVRQPLSALPGELTTQCTVPKALLGLSNLAPGDIGVEASRQDNLAGRERRLALRWLLAQAGVEVVGAGAEIAGLNRRAAHQPLATLVQRAFAVRGLVVPDAARVDQAARWASTLHGYRRRCALPRQLLGRLLEVFVLLDRALFLQERGFQVVVGTLFAPEVSARNLAFFASRLQQE